MTLVAGRYQPLDAARPGQPLRARDLETAQTVLLRDIALPAAAAEPALARAQAARGIFHPSLVTLFDVVPRSGGRLLLAYEFVPAQSILEVSGGQPFHLRRAATLVAEVADAVAELHAREIAHGAISTHSVLLTMKSKAKLDRVGDPSLPAPGEPSLAGDLVALGELLAELVQRPAGGVVGAQAIETLVQRARAGRFESPATLAAMLRRI